jgi:GNAT superfamily N-acetyltransferase
VNAAEAHVPDIAFRQAEPPDAASLGQAMAELTAEYRSFAPPDWKPPVAAAQAELLRQLLAKDDFWCLVAEENGALVGQVAFLPATQAHLPVEDPTLAHLRQLFVRRDHWGTGLATAMHAMAREEVAACGYLGLRLFVPAGQARARRFYEREGWELTRGPFEGGFGLPTVEYRRSVP